MDAIRKKMQSLKADGILKKVKYFENKTMRMKSRLRKLTRT